MTRRGQTKKLGAALTNMYMYVCIHVFGQLHKFPKKR